jgi:hypothetical protein
MPIFSAAHLNNRSARDRQTFYFDAIGGLIVAPRQGYDKPGFLSYTIRPFCPTLTAYKKMNAVSLCAIGVGKELAARGLDTKIAQESISYNWLAGTVRGLHFHDRRLRPHSCSYLRWQALELTAENRRAVYIPNTGFRP